MRVMQAAYGKAAGFSLLEAMIALVIIMVGLLGVAGLQALGVRNSAQAHVRTLASADAQSLAAEMRANSAYWTAPSAQTSAKVVWSGSGTPTITPTTLASAPDCAANNCTATEAAAYSLVQWAQGLSDLPANTTTTVTRLATVGTSASAYLIKVSWSENRMKGQGATATGSERHSTTVVIKP